MKKFMLGKGGRWLKMDKISSRDMTDVKILSNQATCFGYNVPLEVFVKILMGSYEMED